MYGDVAVTIPATGSENTDELNQLVQTALKTVTQSELLTQNTSLDMTVDPNASYATNTAS